jgi:excisionase family DNA binding protein
MNEPLLAAEDVATLLNVPVSWVREHTREGHIPHVRLGRYIRYQRAGVIAWVESQANGGGPMFRKHVPRLS